MAPREETTSEWPQQNAGAQAGWASADLGESGGFTRTTWEGSFPNHAWFQMALPLFQRELLRCVPVPGGDNLPLISSPVAGILSILPALSSSRCKSPEIIFFLSKKEPLLSKAKPLCSRSEIILSNRFVCLFTANEHAEESRVHV